MSMNKCLIITVLLAGCGTVTGAPADGGAGGELGGAGGGAGGGAAGAAGAGQAGAAGGEAGAAGAAPPACVLGPPVNGTWSFSASWCGNGCAACPTYAVACSFPSVLNSNSNGSDATCDFGQLALPNFSIEGFGSPSITSWAVSGAFGGACKTLPAFVCAPTCAACP